MKDAFAGESQANRKYLAFAKKAQEEGYHQVAKLFRAPAESGTIHALVHLGAIGGLGKTDDNLREAISGENYEHTQMYPDFIEEARKEGNKDALRSFSNANKVEQIHEGKFKQAREAVQSGKDLPQKKLFVCPVCGYVEEEHAPERCPVCAAPGGSFKEVQ